MLPNVQQTTIQPMIQQTIALRALIYSDEYNTTTGLSSGDMTTKLVNHSQGEYSHDEACPKLADRMVMVFMKFTQTQLRDFAHSCASGCDPTAVFRRKGCPSTSVSLNLFTMSENVGVHYCPYFYLFF